MAGASLISIVDDDASLGFLLASLIRSVGFQALSFVSAEAFLSSTQARDSRCLIADVRMPGMNGLDTITRIRSESVVPIIAMSGFRLRNSLDADKDFLGMAKLRGATTLLRKPFSPPQLVAAIDRGLGLLPSAGESIQ